MKKRTAWVLVGGRGRGGPGRGGRGRGGPAPARPRPDGRRSPGRDSYLALTSAGEIPEEPPERAARVPRAPAALLRTLVESLDRAAGDPSVKAVVLRVASLPDAGLGQGPGAARRHHALPGKSGKPAYAHLEFAGNKEYYLATACTRSTRCPPRCWTSPGLAAEVTFFSGTLDKLGVQAQFEGVGKYKNAPNQFTETGFTEPHREQMEALLDSLYGQYVAALAESREQAGARRSRPSSTPAPTTARTRSRRAWWTSCSTTTSWRSG